MPSSNAVEIMLRLAERSCGQHSATETMELVQDTRDVLREDARTSEGELVIDLLHHLWNVDHRYEMYRKRISGNRDRELLRPLLSKRSLHLILAASRGHA